MGLIALALSIVLDALRPSPDRVVRRTDTLPSWARRLTTAFAGTGSELTWLGWFGVVGIPVIVVVVAGSLLGAVSGLLTLALHAGLLYLTVRLGPFYRLLSALRLLLGAGEAGSARVLLRRWDDESSMSAASAASAEPPFAAVARARDEAEADADADAESSGPLVRDAIARVLLVAFRDVFAPLLCYFVLPGATGAVLYLFARQAAASGGGVARTAYALIDWIPLRVAAGTFALAGQFEETVFRLKAVSGLNRHPAAADSDGDGRGGGAVDDPYAHQRLFLLPVAGGALGLALTDAQTESELRHRAPDLELHGAEPSAGSMDAAAGLLGRSAAIGFGLYLLVVLLG